MEKNRIKVKGQGISGEFYLSGILVFCYLVFCQLPTANCQLLSAFHSLLSLFLQDEFMFNPCGVGDFIRGKFIYKY